MANAIAIEMDKLIPDYFQGHRMNRILASSGSKIANDILDRYSHWFSSAEVHYNNSHIGAFTSIDTTLVIFLKNLLEKYSKCLSLHIANNFTPATKLSRFDLFSSRINMISQFPPEVQDILVQTLITANLENDELMSYFFNKINRDMKYMKISDKWSDNFQVKACKQPFKDALLKITESELDLEELLNKVTPNIYLLELPESLQGLITSSQRIVLQYFGNPLYSQALTFIAYLHELAKYLLRADPHILTVEDANSLNSDRFIAKDAGLQLEANLFGNVLAVLTDEALDFVYYQQGLTVEEFKSQFAKINTLRPGVKTIYFRTKSSKFFVVGRCGCTYRNSKH